MGYQALFINTTGNENTAIGTFSLLSNGAGDNNTAVGVASLLSNTTGTENIAIGNISLFNNVTGRFNTGTGVRSLFSNTTGVQNTAVGGFSLATNDIGNSNTAIGFHADVSEGNLTNATAIGQGAVVNASNKIRLGNGAVTVIEGQVPFTTPSDGRFKFNVKEDVRGLDFIMQLRPVTYQFDVKHFDERSIKSPVSNVILASYNEATSIHRTGFIAQEVETAAKNSNYDFSGIIKPKNEEDHYSLSYESFVVPLVKAMQEQQQMINKLESQNEELKKFILTQNDMTKDLLRRVEKLESSMVEKNKLDSLNK
jgi:trimeric autotransporter adhesin